MVKSFQCFCKVAEINSTYFMFCVQQIFRPHPDDSPSSSSDDDESGDDSDSSANISSYGENSDGDVNDVGECVNKVSLT